MFIYLQLITGILFYQTNTMTIYKERYRDIHPLSTVNDKILNEHDADVIAFVEHLQKNEIFSDIKFANFYVYTIYTWERFIENIKFFIPEYNLSDDRSNNLSNIFSNTQSDNVKYFDAWYQTYMVRIMKINDNLLFFGGIKELIPPKVAKDFQKFIINKCI